MPEFEFFTPSTADPDQRWASTSRLLNWYREPVGDRKVLKSVLGTRAFADLPGVFCRAMHLVGDDLYVVQAGTLLKVSRDGDVTTIGQVGNSPTVTISSNNGAVTVCSNGTYYVWDGETLETMTPGALDRAGDVTFFAQRTVVSEFDGRRIQWSAPADATDFDALDFATAEARDDAILRLLPIGGQLWVFKEGSIEQWYAADDGPAAIPGSVQEIGLKARGLLCQIPNGAFFVGTDGRAHIAAAGAMRPVSNTAVETSIKTEAPAACLSYADEGHHFLCIAFRGRPAWCYDLATGEWHERAEGRGGAWSARHAVRAFGGTIIGTDTRGLLRLDRNSVDVSGPLIRRAVGRCLENGDRFRVPELRFRCSVGRVTVDTNVPISQAVLGIEETDGSIDDEFLAVITPDTPLSLEDTEPTRRVLLMELRTSPDDGHSWGTARQLPLGNAGEYGTEVVARALGQYRRFTPEITVSEPYDVGVWAEAFVRTA